LAERFAVARFAGPFAGEGVADVRFAAGLAADRFDVFTADAFADLVPLRADDVAGFGRLAGRGFALRAEVFTGE
jgi:hypothetical protein